MKKLIAAAAGVLLLVSCATNPFSGKRTMAFVGNDALFAQSFAEYDAFLAQSVVITGTRDALIVASVGARLRAAAEKWLATMGEEEYLADYRWEYHLVQNNEVNAWCMPGGKIVVYTGILPYAKTETGLAVVMGHEIAHALLSHGQQQVSASVLQQIGAVGVGVGVAVVTGGQGGLLQQAASSAYSAGSTVLGVLPFSRAHESEADEYGLTLMAIAGYNPDEAVAFWQRMSQGGAAGPEFLSTHPADATRIRDIQKLIPKARAIARQVNGD